MKIYEVVKLPSGNIVLRWQKANGLIVTRPVRGAVSDEYWDYEWKRGNDAIRKMNNNLRKKGYKVA